MARQRDAAKERYWRGLIRRHAASGLGTRQFCTQVGIAEHRYHRWRRRLREQDHRQSNSQGRDSASIGQADTSEAGESEFIAVRLPLGLGAPIEVVHPSGYVIRVPAVFDSSVLRRVLAALDLSDRS